MIKKIIKQFFIFISFIGLFFVGIILFADWKISHDTKLYLYTDIKEIPSQKTAMVLGASNNLRNGQVNPFFKYRIIAAKELYAAEKVKAFVLSGENSRIDYNEPEDMKKYLIQLGVPDSVIYLDYAGFRTLDSVIRMKEIFGQSSFIIVSQQFHNERAVFLARHYGLDTYGWNAQDVPVGRVSYKTYIREKFARVKVFIDIAFNKQPKFLGEPIKVTQLDTNEI